MYSLIIPVYRNEDSLKELCSIVCSLNESLQRQLEVVFVVDGSPDNSFLKLKELLPNAGFRSKLILLSRNFGSFSAIRAGLQAATGPLFAVMAADLQEPPLVIEKFFKNLKSGETDIVIGRREKRSDPLLSTYASNLFWWMYRKIIQPEMPPGGVDIFAVNQRVRDELLLLRELNTSLVGLLMWLGFRRSFVGYERLARKHGRSAWTLKKKFRYLTDSIFAFSDLPVRLLFAGGAFIVVASIIFSSLVVFLKITGGIPIPGYATTVLLITFFSGFHAIGLGVLGSYLWRAFENTKERPQSITMHLEDFP